MVIASLREVSGRPPQPSRRPAALSAVSSCFTPSATCAAIIRLLGLSTAGRPKLKPRRPRNALQKWRAAKTLT